MITVTSVLTTGEPVEVKGVCADFEGPYCTTDLRGQQAKCLKCYLEEGDCCQLVAHWLQGTLNATDDQYRIDGEELHNVKLLTSERDTHMSLLFNT